MSITPYSYGNIPTYRFYISKVVGSTTYEVFPLNFLSSSLNDSQENDQIFYRRKFAGSLLFGTNSLVIDDSGVTQNRKDDWVLLWGIEQADPCAKLFFTITKTVSGSTTTYWEGHFSTTDGNFDIDKCTFEVTPMTNDDYTDLLSEADTQYNILTVGPVVSTHAYLMGVMDVTYTRNRWLLDVIEFLADKVISGVTISSDFFTAATNPVTLADNRLLYLTIAQKSDIIRPTSSDQANTAMMSWTELTDILWGMFQVKWSYDGVNTINVEHISWWTKGVGIDLRTQLACKATNKYSYLKEKMPKYEKFAFMEVDNLNFMGIPIRYDSVCVDQNPDTNVKETSVNVTTDIEYINSNPDAISDEGFVILANDNTNHVVAYMGAYDHSVKLNMDLSWANLHDYYFRHNRILKTGYLNNELITFWTAQKNKVQPCSAIICTDLDPTEEITTELGEIYFSGAKATIKQADIGPDGKVKFSLLYGPPDTEPTPMADLKYVKVTQVGAMLTATLSEAADVDFTLTVLEYTDCTMSVPSPQTWDIHIGDTTDMYDITGHIIAGITSSDTDWPVYLIVDSTYICT